MANSAFGKYRLIAELGHGGMADVYLAVARGPAGFSKLVVIKRLRANLADEPDFISMLVDEARLAGRLNHPNVVQTHEVAQEDDQYFIAMEYLEGQPLHRILHRSARLQGFPVNMHVRVLCDVLAGLHHAHELRDYDGTPLNVIHRDATPQNVFVTYDGQVKVVDFGIAKAAGRTSETRTGIIKGKVSYMSPEQAMGGDIDRRADIFSVGIMLWEAATGVRMWKGVEELTVMQHLLNGDIRFSPRAVKPSVSAELDRIVTKAIAFKPQDRYSTAADFQTDLEQLIESERLRVSNRELGDYVSELFNDRRAQQRAIIERQLVELKSMNTDQFQSVSLPVEPLSGGFTPSGTSTREPSAVSLTAPRNVIINAAPSSSSSETATKRRLPAAGTPRIAPIRKGARLTGLVVTGVAAALGVVWITSVRQPPAASQPEAPKTAVPEKAPPRLSEAPPAITLKLQASPADAHFAIDDGPPLANPYSGSFPRDGREHRIEIAAPGYVTKTKLITFSDDHDMEMSLDKVVDDKPVARRAAPTAAPTSTSGDKPPPARKSTIDTEDPWAR